MKPQPQAATVWDNLHCKLLASISYQTEGYEPKIARRLRAVNISSWCAAFAGYLFAVFQFADPTPGAWRVALSNLIGATALVAIPLLHRYGSWAAPSGLAAWLYIYIFAVCYQIGTDTGMPMQYLAVASATILLLGTDHTRLIWLFATAAAAMIVALQVLVPHNTGLFSDATVFANFLFGVAVTCGILCYVVFYAVREAARAEAVAEHEYARSETLLTNILPSSIALRLKDSPEKLIADRYDIVSVLFADMAGFTARASETSPDELILFLNRVFTTFDKMVEQHGLEKIKTTGDAYMVVSGAPTPRADHARALALLALAMREAAAELRDVEGRAVPIRIGMANGPVVAGVVGSHKLFYDVWGDAVNVASRMESTGEAGKIQVSEGIYAQLKDEFEFEVRGPIEVKGKGLMPTWFLKRHRGFGARECGTTGGGP